MNNTQSVSQSDNIGLGDINRYHEKLKTRSNNINHCMVTFYKFKPTDTPIAEDKLQPLRDRIYNQLQELGIKGTVYVGSEGINGTISGPCDNNESNNSTAITCAFEYIQAQPELGEILGKYSVAEFNPFRKLKIKVRPEIVTLKLKEVENPKVKASTNTLDCINKTGIHVDAKEWNELLEDPNTIVIDTRNDFEYKMGTFKNAVNPDTKYFRELPDYVAENLDTNKNKKVAMFCTGGVRCEKSTAYLLDLGFENVYQLNGGILNYFNQTTEEDSLWEGRCFIFDDRIAVDQEMNPCGVPEDYVKYGRRDLMCKDDEY